MIMTGQNIDTKIDNETTMDDLNTYLMKEMNENKKQSWNKLTKTEKIKKLKSYIQDTLIHKHGLTNEERQKVHLYIFTLLDRKRLSKNSEIDYDEESGMIQNIPVISFNESTRHFTLNKELKSSVKKKNVPTQKSKTIKKVKEEESK